MGNHAQKSKFWNTIVIEKSDAITGLGTDLISFEEIRRPVAVPSST